MPQKVWAVGEEALAADFNTYLQQQVVATFPNVAARDAWAAPPNGALCITLDTYTTWIRVAGAWQLYKPLILPACRAHHSADQTIPSGVETTCQFNSERFDTDNIHDPAAPDRLTIKTAGIYLLSFTGHFVSRADYLVGYAQYLLNGSTIIATPGAGGTFTGPSSLGYRIGAVTVWKFAVNDYVQVRVAQANSGGAAVPLQSAAAYSPEVAAVWLSS